MASLGVVQPPPKSIMGVNETTPKGLGVAEPPPGTLFGLGVVSTTPTRLKRKERKKNIYISSKVWLLGVV
jgi:hypothetical protein